MYTKWSDLGFELEKTQDGSPTLRQLSLKNESMHHSAGAYSETEFIYTPSITKIAQSINKPHFFILGLGLGYIEMIVARECLKYNLGPLDVKISSFESSEPLRTLFWQWISNDYKVENEFFRVYEEILQRVQPVVCERNQIKEFLKKNFISFHGLKGNFGIESFPVLKSINCYLYDAFSSKTNLELWTEEFLFEFLNSTKSHLSLFSTYACTGNLKRALKKSGFQLNIQKGFSGKRDFTQATFIF